ncbi:class I SAM-dependent rRNA methyltransferase [Leptospirillum ferrooxidans]|nr:class I SAM-dependent rRNA methyltransferase [Leptospirillum ferrooxidans]
MACTMLFSVFLDNLHMGSNIAMDSVVIKDRGEHEGRLILKKGEERRLLSGHLWVFSNEVAILEKRSQEIPLFVSVESQQGRFLGRAIYNPQTLIAARLLDPFCQEWNGFPSYLEKTIDQAISLRNQLCQGTLYRVVHSEGDFLPGLIVDRYDDFLVVQVTTLAMEAYLPEILAVLQNRFSPRGIRVDRSVHSRSIEGLPIGDDLIEGEIPLVLSVRIRDMAVRFPFREGQKTGLFLDQRRNIDSISHFFRHSDVLDAFCHVGSWSMAAASQGADHVTGVDTSFSALECYRENLSAFSNVSSTVIKQDFFEWAEESIRSGKKYDAVVMDPPAFIKSRKKKEEGVRGYYAANQLAIDLVRPGGILVTCSCSALLEGDELLGIVRSLLKKKRRSGKLVYKGGSGPDHPIVPAMGELEYLKCLAFVIS